MINRLRLGTFDEGFETRMGAEGIPGWIKPQRGLGQRERAVRSGEQPLDARDRALAFAHLRLDAREGFFHARAEDRIF